MKSLYSETERSPKEVCHNTPLAHHSHSALALSNYKHFTTNTTSGKFRIIIVKWLQPLFRHSLLKTPFTPG